MPYYHNRRPVTVSDARVVEGDPVIRRCGLTLECSIDNTTDGPVVVSFRNGLCYNLPSVSSIGGHHRGPAVTFQYRLSLMPGVKFDVNHVLNAPDDELTPEQLIIRNAFVSGSVRRPHDQSVIVQWNYDVTKREIVEAGGVVYLSNLDIQVAALTPDYVPPHPFSKRQVLLNEIVNNEAVNDINKFGYAVQIIDNANSFGDRFINIAGRVFRIPASRDLDRNPGIYLTSSGVTTGNCDYPKPVSEWIPFDQADSSPLTQHLYRTADEAKHYGDEAASNEKQLKLQLQESQRITADLKLEAIRKQAELEDGKRKIELRLEELALLKQRMEMERDERVADKKERREEESYRRKQHYDDRSNNRKDSTELLKLIPVIIGGLLTLKALVDKK